MSSWTAAFIPRISRAEIAEIPFTAFRLRSGGRAGAGRLVVRRIPDLNPATSTGQDELFDLWCFHAFFTTSTLDTVTADKTHRGHAIIEQVHADLKASALAHGLSASFAANSAWLVLAAMAFDLTRAVAAISGPALAKATTATVRRKLIAVPAGIATSARRATPAPAHRVAVGDCLDRTVYPRLRTACAGSPLTTQHPGASE